LRNISFMEYQGQYVESTEVIRIVSPVCKGEGYTSNQEEMNQTKNSDNEKSKLRLRPKCPKYARNISAML